jgi:hypothetical protein
VIRGGEVGGEEVGGGEVGKEVGLRVAGMHGGENEARLRLRGEVGGREGCVWTAPVWPGFLVDGLELG